MKILLNVIGIIALALGALWTLQGSNVLAGSAMSGQSQWLYIGIVMIVVGLVLLYWANMRSRTRPL